MDRGDYIPAAYGTDPDMTPTGLALGTLGAAALVASPFLILGGSRLFGSALKGLVSKPARSFYKGVFKGAAIGTGIGVAGTALGAGAAGYGLARGAWAARGVPMKIGRAGWAGVKWVGAHPRTSIALGVGAGAGLGMRPRPGPGFAQIDMFPSDGSPPPAVPGASGYMARGAANRAKGY